MAGTYAIVPRCSQAGVVCASTISRTLSSGATPWARMVAGSSPAAARVPPATAARRAAEGLQDHQRHFAARAAQARPLALNQRPVAPPVAHERRPLGTCLRSPRGHPGRRDGRVSRLLQNMRPSTPPLSWPSIRFCPCRSWGCGRARAPLERASEDDGVPRRVPQVDSRHLAEWCEQHLGSPPAEELFRDGYLSAVIGLRLVDRREVVVKVRPSSAATGRLRRGASPPLLVRLPLSRAPHGRGPFRRLAGNCRGIRPGRCRAAGVGSIGPGISPSRSRWLIELAPRPGEVPDLLPSPAWTAWSHQEGGLWPWPDDRDIDLNAVDGPFLGGRRGPPCS